MPTYAQDTRLLALNTPLGKDILLLAGFTGEETMSQLFNYELDVISTTPGINPATSWVVAVSCGLTTASTTSRSGFIWMRTRMVLLDVGRNPARRVRLGGERRREAMGGPSCYLPPTGGSAEAEHAGAGRMRIRRRCPYSPRMCDTACRCPSNGLQATRPSTLQLLTGKALSV